MKRPCKVQCPQCPFRHDSAPGWLGAYTPAAIFSQAWRSMPFFCHPTVDYGDPHWERKAMRNGKLCLGYLRFADTMMAPQRADAYEETDKDVLAARKANADRTDIDCMDPREFVRWHEAGQTAKRGKELKARRAAAIAAGYRDPSTAL